MVSPGLPGPRQDADSQSHLQRTKGGPRGLYTSSAAHLEKRPRRPEGPLSASPSHPLPHPVGSAAACLSNDTGPLQHPSPVPRAHSKLSDLEMKKNGLFRPGGERLHSGSITWLTDSTVSWSPAWDPGGWGDTEQTGTGAQALLVGSVRPPPPARCPLTCQAHPCPHPGILGFSPGGGP